MVRFLATNAGLHDRMVLSGSPMTMAWALCSTVRSPPISSRSRGLVEHPDPSHLEASEADRYFAGPFVQKLGVADANHGVVDFAEGLATAQGVLQVLLGLPLLGNVDREDAHPVVECA